jgi:predicted dienelactone hydrolase
MNTGCRDLDVLDPIQKTQIRTRLLYPTHAPEEVVRFGDYTLAVARDAALLGTSLPLIVLSHGTGSLPWVFRDLASHVARAGFIVCLPEHPGNCRGDDGLAFTATNLENRPRHVRLVIDAALADGVVGAHIAPNGVGVIGHSIGAYTTLAAAGGRPTAFANEASDGQSRPVDVVHDSRIRALVLLAPAAAWFVGDDALANVGVPIFLRTGEKDTAAPAIHGDIIRRGIRDPKRIDDAVVPNAGHFSFFSPFPPERTNPSVPPSQDPPGFDRAAYQPILYAEVTAFLKRTLGAS